MRLAFVQYGDYRDAYRRFQQGGGETYYAQRYSVNFVANLRSRADFVGVCSTLGGESYEEELAPGLWSARTPLKAGLLDAKPICERLARWEITHLVLTTPSLDVLRWALRTRVATLPVLADSFTRNGPRAAFAAFRLARLLNRPEITAVGNHNVPASLSLRAIGVRPEKIYPWDWPPAINPERYPAKRLADGPARLVFVGSMTLSKGPGDCIAAAKYLKEAGVDFTMALIGGGPYEAAARRLAVELDVADRVDVRGPQPHDAAVAALEQATLAFITTHHDYAEGLPMTIYESLATRTPIVMSDHPMFRHYFTDARSVRLAPQKSPQALARAVIGWLADPAAYEAASVATADLWRRILCGLTWGDLLSAWLDNPDALPAVLKGRSLEAHLATARGATDRQGPPAPPPG